MFTTIRQNLIFTFGTVDIDYVRRISVLLRDEIHRFTIALFDDNEKCNEGHEEDRRQDADGYDDADVHRPRHHLHRPVQALTMLT